MEYTKDQYGKDLLFDSDTKFQTMMEWEKPYINALIENLNPSGDVLEIGFGLGYSADAIQKFNIKSHTIVEDNPEVLKKLKEWALNQKHHVNIIEGCWQDVLPTLGKFDSVFFDDAPNNKHPDPTNVRLYYFYYAMLINHSNPGCTFSWYCDVPIYWIVHPDTDFKLDSFNINVPDNASYITSQTKNNKMLYMPKIIFKNGTTENLIPVCLDKNFNIDFLNGLTNKNFYSTL